MSAVSVIIPSYQGMHKLPGILKALRTQSYLDFEIIIVVDGSTDGTTEWLNEELQSTSSIKIINQPNKGRAATRNTGAREAKGSLLIFYDDDMLPSENSVLSHVTFHQGNAGIILIGNTPQSTQYLTNDFLRYRAYLSNKWVAEFAEVPTLLNKDTLFMTAANCSMTKIVYQTLGGFNENLKDAEDQELAIRAYKSGIPLFFDKKNIAFHNEYISCSSYILRLRQYAQARQHLGVIHPVFKRSLTPITGSKFFFYRILAYPLLVRIIDHFNLFICLPRNVRYKLYNAITFSLSEVNTNVNM